MWSSNKHLKKTVSSFCGRGEIVKGLIGLSSLFRTRRLFALCSIISELPLSGFTV